MCLLFVPVREFCPVKICQEVLPVIRGVMRVETGQIFCANIEREPLYSDHILRVIFRYRNYSSILKGLAMTVIRHQFTIHCNCPIDYTAKQRNKRMTKGLFYNFLPIQYNLDNTNTDNTNNYFYNLGSYNVFQLILLRLIRIP